MLKKVDQLLLRSFFPPFVVTFGIATFVLLMQILWVYIDDIAGKGLGMFMVMELMAYKCVGLVPMALPLAILISSVMVMGGLSERYELSSFKSAGVSLLRIMRPIIIFGMVAMVVSYWCSDKIIPVANLKFGSRMYDIQQKKPSLSLETGVFNDDFGNYSIRIGKKHANGKDIEDVLMYDHTDANSGKLSQVVAESGQMFTTPDGNFFIMELYNGHQYAETSQGRSGSSSSGFPFVRTAFKSYRKVFDLSEFNMAVTAPDLFEGNRSMLGISQLRAAIDSIQVRIDNRYKSLANHIANYYSILEVDSLYVPKRIEEEEVLDQTKKDSLNNFAERQIKREEGETEFEAAFRKMNQDSIRLDSIRQDSIQSANRLRKPYAPSADPKRDRLRTVSQTIPGIPPRGVTVKKAGDSAKVKPAIAIERFGDTLRTVEAWMVTLRPEEQRRFRTRAKSAARAILSQAESAIINLDRTRENKVKHIYDMHTKFSMAVVCIIFVFIGAPLGAIIRKGGFGYPLLVSVVAFIFFVVMTIFCRKIAETFIMPADVAAWLPCAVLFPIGLWLTNKARKDSKLFEGFNIKEVFLKLLEKIKKKDAATT